MGGSMRIERELNVGCALVIQLTCNEAGICRLLLWEMVHCEQVDNSIEIVRDR